MKNRKMSMIVYLLAAMALILAGCGLANGRVTVTPVEVESGNAGFSVFDGTVDISTALSADVTRATDLHSADEMVGVIVEIKGNSLVEIYSEQDMSCSFTEFVSSSEGDLATAKIDVTQKRVIDALVAGGYVTEADFSIKALLNAFTTEVRYGDISTICKIEGVKNVIVSTDMVINSVDTEAVYSSVMSTNGIATNGTEYQGDGMVVAVIDTGIMRANTAFAQAPSSISLTKAELNTIIPKLSCASRTNATKAYYSDKIAFQFNYVSKNASGEDDNGHGTHVSGILTGNDNVITGVVPDAQIVAMKVGNAQGSATIVNIISALNDCILLGVDVVNISMGFPMGFPTYQSESMDFCCNALDLAKQVGVTIVCSAGNSYSKTYLIENTSGGDSADIPDTGTISGPASYNAANATASVESTVNFYFIIGESKYTIRNCQTASQILLDFTGKMLGENDSGEFEIVFIAGTGVDEDYEGIDVTNKIVFVKRGELSFEQKALNAQAQGAIGCIVGNTIETNVVPSVSDEFDFALCVVDLEDALSIERLCSQSNITVRLDKEDFYYTINDYSAWGPLCNLELGIDFASFGGNVYSSYLKNAYGYMSGTSMASPNAAGILTAVKQYLKQSMPELSEARQQTVAKQLVMSTATALRDINGVVYSPRHQGSGLADVQAAVLSNAYLSVTGKDSTSLSIGHDKNKEGIYTLKFNLVNFGTESLSYAINPDVITETFNYGDLGLVPYELNPDWTLAVSNGTIEGTAVTVEGGQTAIITVVLYLTNKDIAYLDQFENGIYVEGFVSLNSKDNVDLSIPFLSFYGDWTKALVFDSTAYDNKDPYITNTFLMGLYNLFGWDYYIPFGGYITWNLPEGMDYERPETDESYIALSQQVYGNRALFRVNLSLLRNITKLTYILRDVASGTEYYGAYAVDVTSTYLDNGSASMPSHILNILIEDFAFSNNQQLELELIAEVDGEGEYSTQSMTFPILIDSENPMVLDAGLVYENDKVYVNMEVYDNHYLSNFFICKSVDGGETVSTAYPYAIPAYKWKRGEANEYRLDVTDFMQYVDGDFYLMLMDYALNQTIINLGEINLPVEEVNNITANNVITGSYDFDGDVLNVTSDRFDGIVDTVEAQAENDQVEEFIVVDGVLKKYNGKGGDVAIPNDMGITEIGRNAFSRCYTLTSVWIPKEITALMQSVFIYCFYLEKVTFEEGSQLTRIDHLCFYECLGLKSINLQDTQLTYVGESCFYFCWELEELTLPAGTLTVGARAFNGLRDLKKFTCYADATFEQCFSAESLEEVYFYGNLTTKGDFMASIPNCRILEFHGDIDLGTGPSMQRFSFCFMTNLEILHFYGSVNIKGLAFGSESIKRVIFHDNVIAISQEAFCNNSFLKSFSVSDDNEYMFVDEATGIMYNNDKTMMYTTSVWDFSGEFTIPDTVTGGNMLGTASSSLAFFSNTYQIIDMEVGTLAYSRMIGSNINETEKPLLTKVILGEGLTVLGSDAFKGFTSLTEVVGLENVEELNGGQTFFNCRSIENITLPENTTNMNWMFANCTSLKSIFVPASVEEIYCAFNGCTSLEYIMGMEGVYYIEGAFINCHSLKEITIPESIECLAGFENCYSLESVEVLGCIYEIYGCAFKNCRSLKSLSFPDCYYVEDEAFMNCESLTSIELGCDLCELYSRVFYGCTSLTAFDFSCISYLGYECFAYSGLEEIYLGEGLTDIESEIVFFECKNVKFIEVSEDNEAYASQGGVLFDKKLTSLIWYPAQMEGTEYAVPDTVISIADRAFIYAGFVNSIDLANVVSIGRSSFECSGLNSVSLGDLEFVGSFAFRSCSKLTDVFISESTCFFDIPFAFINSPVDSIEVDEKNRNYVSENGILYNGSKTMIIMISDFTDETLVITEGVVKISAFAMQNNTYVKRIVLPSTLKVVGANAFRGCDNLEFLEFNSEKAPTLEGLIEYDKSLYYANFDSHIEDVNDENRITIVCGNDASYYSYIWIHYFAYADK
ncbi:MAG: leucine-rich repeat protein [Clostridia bacterium]|nr:leucine-rich repeat protein [Clostridia bacterium]